MTHPRYGALPRNRREPITQVAVSHPQGGNTSGPAKPVLRCFSTNPFVPEAWTS